MKVGSTVPAGCGERERGGEGGGVVCLGVWEVEGGGEERVMSAYDFFGGEEGGFWSVEGQIGF